MARPRGANRHSIASQALQALEPELWENIAKNYPKALKKLEHNLTSKEATPQQEMQALKFYLENGSKLIKEHRGKTHKDFEDKTVDKRGRKSKEQQEKEVAAGIVAMTMKETGTD